MVQQPEDLHEKALVVDGQSASEFTEEYVTETLPNANIDGLRKNIASSGDDFLDAMEGFKKLHRQVEQWPTLYQVKDATQIREQDGVGVIFALEDTTPIEFDSDNIRIFHSMGIRIIQLTYNSRNFCGNGCTERVDGGISNFGLEVIEKIESNNIVLDLSHVGSQTALDALNAATQPTIFSHSNPQAVYNHPRNISDEHIKAAAETGGTVGVNAFPGFVGKEPTIDDLIDHIEYMADIVGYEHVSLGLDFIDNISGEDMSVAQNPAYPNPPYTYPTGIESAAAVPEITKKLSERGFTEKKIQGILGENLINVYENVWGN